MFVLCLFVCQTAFQDKVVDVCGIFIFFSSLYSVKRGGIDKPLGTGLAGFFASLEH